MNIDQIRSYEKNAKKHPDDQLRKIAKSLKEFGWQQPIVVNKDGVIIVGHSRYMAYTKYPEGIKEPKIEVADLTEEQEKAYRLADNKLNESDWEIGFVIDDLKGMSPELIEITGFEKTEEIKEEQLEEIKTGKINKIFCVIVVDIDQYMNIKQNIDSIKDNGYEVHICGK